MSREAILRNVRAALGRDTRGEGEASAAAERRLAARSRHLLPQVGSLAGAARKAQLIAALERQATRVIEVADAAAIPAAVASYLADVGAAQMLRVGADPVLAGLPWETAPALTRLTGAAEAPDTASLSHAVAAVAETGTLVLASGADNPTSLAFMVETHIVAVAGDAIVGCYEDAFDRVRAIEGSGRMPRALNLISGASRTGDIGGRIVTGAHGPRRLAVIIYASAAVEPPS